MKILLALMGVLVAMSVTLSFFALRVQTEPAPQELPDERPRGDLPGEAEFGDLMEEVRTLRARVEELELQAALRPASEEAAVKGGTLLEALQESSPELDALIADAVARSSAADEGMSAEDQKRAAEKAAKAANVKKFVAYVDGEIDRWAEEYELSAGQVEDLGELTRRAVDERMAAQENGASKEELAEFDVDVQADVRNILGDETYYAIESERLTGEARRTVRWVSMSVGSLTDEQHSQVDAVIESAVESKLDLVVRVRSEQLSPDERNELQTQIKQVDTQAWERMRDEVLTESQRRRIPGK